MPGIPKTKRCERCRRRRIKCDENWPTCTGCLRSNAVCSGPTTGLKFIYNNQHSKQDTTYTGVPVSSAVISTATPHATNDMMKTIASSSTNSGPLMSAFRVSSQQLRPYPTTESDRVASRLVNHLEKSNQGIRQFLLTSQFLEFVPARVGNSVALRDCVALFASAWANFQRGLPCSEITDRKMYGKALRSLYRAVSGGGPFSSETLAAITVLERFEIMFDPGRPLYWSSHRDGITGIMKNRGPPKLDDELDVWLALDNYNILAAHWLVRGGNDFYDDEGWKIAMRHAIASCARMSEMKKFAYQFELFMGEWASMVWEMQYISEAPDEASRQRRAIHLQHRAITLAAKLDHVGTPMIDQGRVQGLIVEVPDPDTPVGAKYNFANMDAQRGVSNYAMLRIIANRISWSTTMLLDDQADASLDLEHERFCRMVWMCLPYTREVSLMAAILFGDPLYISYEGARGEIKEYLLTWIIEICQFRKRVPNDRDKVDQYLISTALAATGRGKFNERSDFPYWEIRSSCLNE